jgi:predicted Zn-dependent protease with MMP-like domain
MDMRTFERIVQETLDHLPRWAIDCVDNLRVVVQEWPAPDQDPHGDGLLGLYDGIPLHDRGPEYYAEMPDTIFIFRQPHLELGLPEAELIAEIRRTVIHELAHYFGIDDARLDDIGWG